MGAQKILGGVGILAVAVVVGVALTAKRNVIPDHMLNHELVDLPDFFTEKEVDDLLQFTRDTKVIPPLAREYDSYTPLHSHTGEATPYNGTGDCPPYTIPNPKKTLCIFPGRIDVGRHFIKSGGPGAIKQRFDTMVTRLYGFIKYFIGPDMDKHELPKRLLKAEKFVKLAKSVCPSDRNTILDPVQLNLIVQLPGQTVATHVDAVYYQRSSRFHVPQWVHAVMRFSGLFNDEFIPQVQVVGYYHKWTDTNRSGLFKFWNDKSIHPTISHPSSRSANAVDGSKVVHAADVYMPHELPPKLPMDAVNEIVYNNVTKLWDLTTDKKVVKSYPENDLRFSVVYRARCFASEKDQKKYYEDQNKPMELEEIWGVLRKDLTQRGIITEGQQFTPYDWGLLLLDTYIKYPLSPDAIIPYNYCALDRVYKWLAPVLPFLGCK